MTSYERADHRAEPHTESPVLAGIHSRLETLNPAEAKVARTLLHLGTELIYRSANEIATEAGAALSTVVRTCQVLGFTGFQDLKLSVAREGHPVAPSELQEDLAPGDDPATVLAKFGRAAREALDFGLRHIDPSLFDDAVRAVVQARSVVCLGVGTSAPMASDTAYRLLWIGIAAEAPSDVHTQHVRGSVMQPGDVALVISHTGATRETVETARAAAAAGATVIAITSFPRSPLTDVADITLVAASHERPYAPEALSGRLAHIAALDALWVAAATMLGEDSLAKTRRIADIIAGHRY